VRVRSQYVHLSELKSLRRIGRIFAVFSAYLDESKNSDALVIGGWICSDEGWKSVEHEWDDRIKYEQRISEKRGFAPISRFHAADCSSLLNEFDRSKGWNNDRQLRFIKKLVGILGKKRKRPLFGIVIGASLKGWEKAYASKKRAEKNVYRLCMMNCASTIGKAMDIYWPNERFSIFYEHGPFHDAAQSAYAALKAPDCIHRDKIVTVAPLTWRDAIALQPADFLAYEGMKSTNLAIKTGMQDIQSRMRKSLAALLGTGVGLHGSYFTNDVFDATLNWRKSGKLESNLPVAENL
jgi:hypothetical protein